MIPEELKNTKVRVNEDRQVRAKVVLRLLSLGFGGDFKQFGDPMGESYGLYLHHNGSIVAETHDIVGTDFKQRTEYREVTIKEIFEL